MLICGFRSVLKTRLVNCYVQSKPGEVKDAVKASVACGYRLLDCAYCYQNEAEIGEALTEIFKEGSVQREDLFIISKVCECSL